MPQLAQLEPQAVHHEPKGGGIWPMAAQGKSHGGLRRFRGEMVISYVMYGRIIPLIRNGRS